MPAAKKSSVPVPPAKETVKLAMQLLEEARTDHDFENLARFGITANRAMGVSMANIQKIAKRIGKSHELAAGLWKTGYYEARMLTAYVDEPDKVTPEQMDQWRAEFDNWGICDTLCFVLFDRTPHAWKKVSEWAELEDEYGRRAGFALLASLAGHDKKSGDKPFLDMLPLIERAAYDDRNFVKKGVNWALRRMGGRSPVLRKACQQVAERLAESTNASARWVGKDALRDWGKGKKWTK